MEHGSYSRRFAHMNFNRRSCYSFRLQKNLVGTNVFQDVSAPVLEYVYHCHFRRFEKQYSSLFQVPLNYSDPEGAEAIIAVIRKPSTLAESSPEYRGPILFNPGGPGDSGVEFINKAGDVMSSIIGPQFDIVSFDPRGMCHQRV